MLEFLIDNIFVSFGGTLFQQVVGIPMGTNCAPVLADLFLYAYTGPCIANQLRDVNTTYRRSWYIAAHVPFIINCSTELTTDLFLYAYESEFLQKLVKNKKIHEARAFNFTYRYIDDVLS
jgi:hypothetical protein